ncbi:TPA: nitrite transporter [Citrobacter amalonaticus]|uniref:nitrite transporter n=1 Tax=Citrobacter amalonaticus TaxID=35703 RepID=UPI00115A52F7|nr:nitrite transporter [Citrobacter amalonaticus]QDK86445.1 nitrite transporter [Citrobacter amalonaticus]HAU5593112.1 nitrite transporter [Citrobacter amalonaticus]HDP8882389.1 nitrite transporter [Citrobacter amalonaticus]
MFNPDKYLSVKWLKGGRVYPELDCFGGLNEVRRDIGLPEWPDFAGVTKDNGRLDREARKLMRFLRRCEPCEGAGVAYYSGSTVAHVAVVVNINGQLYVAECNHKTNVTFLPLARFMRRFVKAEFWA